MRNSFLINCLFVSSFNSILLEFDIGSKWKKSIRRRDVFNFGEAVEMVYLGFGFNTEMKLAKAV